ncbi:MAG: Nif3-like dinuclear metal center hexameric protein, partial [Oscillospiraceae bacterium]|nr:Nif3-like dinuclear metal center hexameric protein [Oscillospiraceae bacterium]
LGSGAVRVHDAGRPVSRVCVASGAGFSAFEEARAWGADTFVCGEAKHSAFLDAAHAGINLLDCGHHATEVVVFKPLIAALRRQFPAVEFRLSERQGEPYYCI